MSARLLTSGMVYVASAIKKLVQAKRVVCIRLSTLVTTIFDSFFFVMHVPDTKNIMSLTLAHATQR